MTSLMSAIGSAIQATASFVTHHTIAGSIIVFLLALSESLPVIGALSPGTATILAISAMAGLGYIPVWTVMIAALLGAIAGDGLAFWFGHHFKDRALRMWPLSLRPELIAKSEDFFARHGGKSILAARFTPVVRAFVPLIAGVSGMSPSKFYTANIMSAVLWSSSHVGSAAAAGASLAVLHQVSGRLVAVIIALAAGAWLVSFAMQRGVRWGARWVAAALNRAHAKLEGRNGRLAQTLRALTEPQGGGAREVAFLGAAIALAFVLTFNLIEDVLAQGQIVRADAAISALASSWRTSLGDSIMVFVTALGDTAVTGTVAAIAAIWIAIKGERRMSLAIVAVIATTALFVVGMKATMQVPRPTILYRGHDAFSFPSGHTTFAATLYGILAWIGARDLERPWASLVVSFSAAIVTAIAVSRIYLQAHWPSDVAMGLIFGMAMTAAFSLAFRGSNLGRLQPGRLLGVAFATLAIAGSWHAAATHTRALAFYAPQIKRESMTYAEWLLSGWRKLPARRVDLGGEREEPIVFQWAGTSAALESALSVAGWKPAVPLSIHTANAYVSGTTTVDTLPVLPRLNDGEEPVFSFVKPSGPVARTILHLWQSRVVLSDRGDVAVLMGALVMDKLTHPLPFLTLPSYLTRLEPTAIVDFEQTFVKAGAIATALHSEGGAHVLLAAPN